MEQGRLIAFTIANKQSRRQVCDTHTTHLIVLFFFLLLCTKKGKTRNQLAKIYMYIYIFFSIINDREIVQPSVKFHPSVAGK